MNTFAQNAIILAAGLGSRMRPLTLDIPKSLASVGDTTILGNSLNVMRSIGVEQFCVVCGYKADVLIDYCRKNHDDLDIQFCINNLYESTNSMFSMKIGLEYVKKSSWVLEGDILFGQDVFPKEKIEESIVWFGDSTYRESGGSFLSLKRSDYLKDVAILQSKFDIGDGLLKSAGIVGIKENAIPEVLNWLEEGVKNGQADFYYDLIFAQYAADFPIRVFDIAPARWFEVDTMDELKDAEKAFRGRVNSG